MLCVLVAGCASKEMAPEANEDVTLLPAVSLLLTPAETLTSGESCCVQCHWVRCRWVNRRNAVGCHRMDATTGLEGTLQPIPSHPTKRWLQLHSHPIKVPGAHAGTDHCRIRRYEEPRRVFVLFHHSRGQKILKTIELEKIPTHWIGATGKFFVREKDGNKILVKPPPQRGLDRSNVYIGPSTMKDYQIQVDLMGTRNKRRLPDMGLIANRYTLDMQGKHQRLQIRSWASDLRMAEDNRLRLGDRCLVHNENDGRNCR